MNHLKLYFRRKIVFPLFLLSGLILSGCYVNLNHTIDREVRVSIVEDVPITITNTGNSTFNEYMSEDEYRSKYLAALRAELGGTTNIILTDENPEYLITITSFTIQESTKEEKINDSESPDNGKIFELTTLDFTAQGSVKNLSTGKSRSWYANKSKSESTTSSRSAGQLVTGDNKDKNEYREKDFDSGTAADFTNTIGSRSGIVIVKEISKSMK